MVWTHQHNKNCACFVEGGEGGTVTGRELVNQHKDRCIVCLFFLLLLCEKTRSRWEWLPDFMLRDRSYPWPQIVKPRTIRMSSSPNIDSGRCPSWCCRVLCVIRSGPFKILVRALRIGVVVGGGVVPGAVLWRAATSSSVTLNSFVSRRGTPSF